MFSPLASTSVAPWLFSASLLALIAWLLWHHDRLRGAWLVGLGVALNLAVVLGNGGHMPVPADLARRGPKELVEVGTWGQYVLAGPGTRLGWLGDWVQLPQPIHTLFPQAYSPGDLVALAGMVVALFLATRAAPAGARSAPLTTP